MYQNDHNTFMFARGAAPGSLAQWNGPAFCGEIVVRIATNLVIRGPNQLLNTSSPITYCDNIAPDLFLELRDRLLMVPQ